ncbi:MAG: ABC transporter ATP-binding protein [Chloroflexi bacterium]|nr:ABC transporter ATP-binding protein [Chloroflexota bacterium]
MAEVPGEPVIAARALTKRYGDLVALDGVSLSVGRGEIFGILGPNGAGKTTFVEILEGLTRPTSGTATVMGFEVTTHPTEVKQRIGVQLQASSYHQYLTLREILDLFGSFYPEAADPMELLRRVHLEDRAGARIQHLSGGMKQRFSIVAALVNEPKLVFFDEPTAGLDPDARHDLWSIVREVRDSGATVVLTTHYMEEAEALCDRVMLMHAGQVAALDTPAGLVRSLQAPYRVRVTTTRPLPDGDVTVLDGVTEVVRTTDAEAHVLAMRAQDAPRTVAALTASADRTGAAVIDLAVLPATLEDVFLATTGRGLGGA